MLVKVSGEDRQTEDAMKMTAHMSKAMREQITSRLQYICHFWFGMILTMQFDFDQISKIPLTAKQKSKQLHNYKSTSKFFAFVNFGEHTHRRVGTQQILSLMFDPYGLFLKMLPWSYYTT